MRMHVPAIPGLFHSRHTSRVTSCDRALAKHLHDIFEFDLEEASLDGIHFYTKDGVVTLHGTVTHTLDEELLVGIVEDVAGVEKVISNLTHVRQA